MTASSLRFEAESIAVFRAEHSEVATVDRKNSLNLHSFGHRHHCGIHHSKLRIAVLLEYFNGSLQVLCSEMLE